MDKDLALVYTHLGKEFVKRLWETLPAITIHVSTKSLKRAQKRYIIKHFNGNNVKDLCILLDVSESFVYKAIEERHQALRQSPLFELPSIS